MVVLYIFCFKQKTAYEMRISDWSSDVCSSDLTGFAQFQRFIDAGHPETIGFVLQCLRTAHRTVAVGIGLDHGQRLVPTQFAGQPVVVAQIGRASWRESVCQYV